MKLTARIIDASTNMLMQFVAAKRGNVIVTFALALIPVTGAVGAAVDYSRGNSAKSALQAATDAAGLILSKEAQSLTQPQLVARADSVVKANLNRSDISNLKTRRLSPKCTAEAINSI